MQVTVRRMLAEPKGSPALRSGAALTCGGDPLFPRASQRVGRLAQLVEHLVYTERVGGSSPSPPTSLCDRNHPADGFGQMFPSDSEGPALSGAVAVEELLVARHRLDAFRDALGKIGQRLRAAGRRSSARPSGATPAAGAAGRACTGPSCRRGTPRPRPARRARPATKLSIRARSVSGTSMCLR